MRLSSGRSKSTVDGGGSFQLDYQKTGPAHLSPQLFVYIRFYFFNQDRQRERATLTMQKYILKKAMN